MPPRPAGAGADALDQSGRVRIDATFGRRRARRLRQQAGRDLLVGRRIGGIENRCRGCIRDGGNLRIQGHERVRLALHRYMLTMLDLVEASTERQE